MSNQLDPNLKQKTGPRCRFPGVDSIPKKDLLSEVNENLEPGERISLKVLNAYIQIWSQENRERGRITLGQKAYSVEWENAQELYSNFLYLYKNVENFLNALEEYYIRNYKRGRKAKLAPRPNAKDSQGPGESL